MDILSVAGSGCEHEQLAIVPIVLEEGRVGKSVDDVKELGLQKDFEPHI